MATHLREDMAAQTAADICSDIASGLDSDPVAKPLAAIWDALTVKGDALAVERRKLERVLGRARAKVVVIDAFWDAETGAFGRDALDKSGGLRKERPYSRFFPDVAPSDVQAFGIDREVQQGRAWIRELGRDSSEPLAKTWTPRLTNSTDALEKAGEARAEAMKPLAMHSTTEELYIEEINVELDKLEGKLIEMFPRQPKRVAAFLAPTKPRRKRSSKEEGENET